MKSCIKQTSKKASKNFIRAFMKKPSVNELRKFPDVFANKIQEINDRNTLISISLIVIGIVEILIFSQLFAFNGYYLLAEIPIVFGILFLPFDTKLIAFYAQKCAVLFSLTVAEAVLQIAYSTTIPFYTNLSKVFIIITIFYVVFSVVLLYYILNISLKITQDIESVVKSQSSSLNKKGRIIFVLKLLCKISSLTLPIIQIVSFCLTSFP